MLLLIIGMSLLYSYVMSYLHQPVGCAMGGRYASIEMAVVGSDLVDGDRARFLLAAGIDHLDDCTYHFAAIARSRFRSDLVRYCDDCRDGNGFDPSTGRTQFICHQKYCARYSLVGCDQGNDSVPGADVFGSYSAMPVPESRRHCLIC